MIVGKHNYEELLLEFWEAKLSQEEIVQLKQFIHSHPELGSWEELLEGLVVLQPSSTRFLGKELLKQPEIIAVGSIEEENAESYFIAQHEGQLEAHEQEELRQFLKENPSLKDEFQLYGKLRLAADEKLVFPDKEALKQRTRIVKPAFYRAVSIAASIVLFISVAWWFTKDSETISPGKTELLTQINAIPTPQKIAFSSENDSFTNQLADRQSTDLPINPQLSLPKEDEFISDNRFTPLPAMAYLQQAKIPEISFEKALPNHLEAISSESLLALIEDFETNRELSATEIAFTTLAQGVGGVKNFANKLSRLFEKEVKVSELIENVNLWDIADAGIKTYNAITNNDVELHRQLDEDGKLQYIRFKSEILYYSKNY